MSLPAGSRLLVLNAGSSSLKFAVYAAGTTLLLRGEAAGLGTGHAGWTFSDGLSGTRPAPLPDDGSADHAACLALLLPWLAGHAALQPLAAVGHRIVHGGSTCTTPLRIDAALRSHLEALVALAPLHQPQGLAGVDAIARHWPALPQVACFDTAFHATQPESASTVALPATWRARGYRRYGFHGLSCMHVVRVLRERAPALLAGRVVIAHLGNGASLTALAAGRSVANSMGYSTLDGLPMGTRCGSLDPGILIALLREGVSLAELEDQLYHHSGLRGLSGRSGDMRELLARAPDDPAAGLAVEVFVHHARRGIAAMAADLGGLDALVFTGGIGARSGTVRARIVDGLRWLGIGIESARNDRDAPEISAPDSPVRTLVVEADEERVIADATFALLA